MIPSIRNDLYNAFKQPGCPVCQVVVQAVSHYIRSIFYEKINDRELRAELRNCCDRDEYREIEAELKKALAELDAWLDTLTFDEEPPS